VAEVEGIVAECVEGFVVGVGIRVEELRRGSVGRVGVGTDFVFF
jgi:hypothetical protein